MKIVIAGLIAAATFLAGTPAHAEADPLADWVTTVNKKLDRNIAYPSGGQHGVAYATIRRTEDGRAVLVKVNCEDRALARAARLTVARLRNVPPLPMGYKGSAIRMQMLIGDTNNPNAFYARRKQLLADAANKNAQYAARMAGSQLASVEAR